MKITCDREKLLLSLQTVAAVAPARSPKPILQNVKLEVSDAGSTLYATDLEVSIRREVEGVEAEEPGTVLLPVGRFSSILRESTDATVRLESDGQKTVIRGERSTFNLPTENPAEFPEAAGFDESAYYQAARLLKEMIRRTIFATDNESSRYALGGVKFENGSDDAAGQLIAVGTDGRRLAKMQGPIESVGEASPFGDATIIPSRALQLIDRTLTDDDAVVKLAVRQNEVIVSSPATTLSTRLLEGRYPRWRDVFPQRTESAQVELTVGPFFAAVRQAMIVTSDESRGVDFTFGEGTLVLSGQAAEVGESRVELPIGYPGEPIGITLDPRFLVDFLKTLDAEKSFTFDLVDGDSAAVAQVDDGYGYVIMPLAATAGETIDRAKPDLRRPGPPEKPMDPDTTQKLRDHAHKADKQRRRFYARRPKTIESVLAQVIAKRGYAAKRGAAELGEAWAEAAGPALAPHTRVVGVRRGKLEVTVANSAMMQEINFHRPTLLAAMQKALPQSRITDLRLKVGRLR